MLDPKPITKYVADWLRRADEDVNVAEILLKDGGILNSICFHCQQAVEKYLKGFLAYQEKHVRKIHDIEMLMTLCEEIDNAFKELRPAAAYLSKFYIETRYPGDYPDFTWEEAKQSFEAARKIKDFVLGRIK